MRLLGMVKQYVFQDGTSVEPEGDIKRERAAEKVPLMIRRLVGEVKNELDRSSPRHNQSAADEIRQWRPGPLSDSFPMG